MRTSKKTAKRIKIGIVANEFFAPRMGGMGGFGWAARHVANLFDQHPEHGVDAIFLNRTLARSAMRTNGEVHDIPIITRGSGRLSSWKKIRKERLDLLLMIDYRPSYRFFAAALPRTPIIVWSRDPRSAADVEKVDTLRIPGAESTRPQGSDAVNCKSLGKIVRASRLVGRPVIFATPAPSLAAKVPGTYDVKPREVFFLPNIIELENSEAPKRARPLVAFLGRLDPQKRPWLFAKLAEQFPDVDFIFMGNAHFTGEGAWRPVGLPNNVRMLGHVNEPEKSKLLASSWFLVNTSIHEGLAVSFLEALACGTPIISCQNTEDVVSRFGVYVGRWDGAGSEALPFFAEALRMLLRDTALRTRLGREGRAWVAETHTPGRFLDSFRELCTIAGVGASAG